MYVCHFLFSHLLIKSVDPTCRFWVDDIPIREFVRNETATPYPNHQPMEVYCSIWDGDSWATEGGRIKINWADAPFVATYRNYTIEACSCGNTTADITACQNSRYAYPGPAARNLSTHGVHQMEGVKRGWLKYDYCWYANTTTYPECQYNIL